MNDVQVVIACVFAVWLVLTIVIPRKPKRGDLELRELEAEAPPMPEPPPIPNYDIRAAHLERLRNPDLHQRTVSHRLIAYKAQLRREIRLEQLQLDEERAWLEELKVIEWSVKTHYPDAIKAELYAICHRDRRPS